MQSETPLSARMMRRKQQNGGSADRYHMIMKLCLGGVMLKHDLFDQGLWLKW